MEEELTYFSTQDDKKEYESAVIFLHGLSSMGERCFWIFQKSYNILKEKTLFVFPNAKIQPVTINNGKMSRSWYNITHDNFYDDEEGFIDSSRLVMDLITKLESRNKIKRERILLGGFSQGGAVTLFTILNNKGTKLAGYIVLSSYLPFHRDGGDYWIRNKEKLNDMDCPSFWGHGNADTIVPLTWAEESINVLSKLNNVQRQVNTYKDILHHVSDQEMDDLNDFILDILGK